MFKGMEDFQWTCRNELTDWFNENREKHIDFEDTFVVWACKTLQNMKCLCSTNVDGDTTYAEFTYNGDKKELYCDYYVKEKNVVWILD